MWRLMEVITLASMVDQSTYLNMDGHLRLTTTTTLRYLEENIAVRYVEENISVRHLKENISVTFQGLEMEISLPQITDVPGFYLHFA